MRPLSYPTIGHIDLGGEEEQAPVDVANVHLSTKRGDELQDRINLLEKQIAEE